MAVRPRGRTSLGGWHAARNRRWARLRGRRPRREFGRRGDSLARLRTRQVFSNGKPLEGSRDPIKTWTVPHQVQAGAFDRREPNPSAADPVPTCTHVQDGSARSTTLLSEACAGPQVKRSPGPRPRLTPPWPRATPAHHQASRAGCGCMHPRCQGKTVPFIPRGCSNQGAGQTVRYRWSGEFDRGGRPPHHQVSAPCDSSAGQRGDVGGR